MRSTSNTISDTCDTFNCAICLYITLKKIGDLFIFYFIPSIFYLQEVILFQFVLDLDSY